jgi:RNA polymerase sigma-70 factor, ECF subfamily
MRSSLEKSFRFLDATSKSMDQKEPDVAGEIIAKFEAELRKLAHWKMRHQPRSLLQTTALLNSACRRMIAASQETPPDWTDQAHFLRVAAKAMRSVLTDYARKRESAKRGGRAAPQPIEEMSIPGDADFQDRVLDVLDIHETIEEQASINPDYAEIVELRYFGGLTVEETSLAAGVGVKKVKLACAQLKRLLQKREEEK